MKKICFLISLAISILNTTQAQIKTRTLPQKPVSLNKDKQEILRAIQETKNSTPNTAVSNTGNTQPTVGGITPIPIPTGQAMFSHSFSRSSFSVNRTAGLSPSDNKYAFFAIDNNKDGLKDILYRDFENSETFGLVLKKTDAINVDQQTVFFWNGYADINLTNSQHIYDGIPGDMNGDGRGDLIVFNRGWGLFTFLNTVSALQSSGGEQFFLTKSNQFHYWPTNPVTPEYIALPGDFNKDGKSDAAIWMYQTGNWQVALSNGTNLVTAAGTAGDNWISNWGINQYAFQPLSGDFNGDGFTDIAIREKATGNWQVALNQNNSFVPANGCMNTFWCQGWAMDAGLIFRSGDFNGDKKSDILAFNPADGMWQFAISNGSCFNFFPPPLLNYGVGANTYPLVGDINGDGKDDVLACMLNPASSTLSSVGISGAISKF